VGDNCVKGRKSLEEKEVGRGEAACDYSALSTISMYFGMSQKENFSGEEHVRSQGG